MTRNPNDENTHDVRVTTETPGGSEEGNEIGVCDTRISSFESVSDFGSCPPGSRLGLR